MGLIYPSNANTFEIAGFNLKKVIINSDKEKIENKQNVFEVKKTQLNTTSTKEINKSIKAGTEENKTNINPIKKRQTITIYPKATKKKVLSKQNNAEKNKYVHKTQTKSPIETKHPIINEVKTEEKNLPEIKDSLPLNSQITSTNEPLNLEDLPNKKELNKIIGNNKQSYPDLSMLIGALSLVLMLIFIIFWLYAKYKGIPTASLLGNAINNDKKLKFNIISSTPIGQGKDIHLVEINGKQIVLGSTASSISVITEIDENCPEIKKNNSTNEIFKEIYKNNNIDDEPIHTNPEIYENSYADLYKEYINKSKKED